MLLYYPLRYRLTMVFRDMGWVDYDFSHSTVCQVLLRQMGVWQKMARCWKISNQGQPNP